MEEENKTNKISPYLNIFTDKVCNNNIPEDEIAYNFPYKLDAFQQEAIYRIYSNENVLITAHTGSGKTIGAIYGIAHCIKNNKKVIYTSPIKSLSNQKYAEFKQIFDSVGILTGDIKMNPDAQCIIMTTEILRNILYRYSNGETGSGDSSFIDINDVGIVIFDEVHYINDPSRGKVWEESIVLLPKNINLVMLSATIDKPEQFASWIGNIKEKPINLIPTSHRVVPLRHYFWKSYLFDNNGKEDTRWELVEILDEQGKFKNYDLIKKGYKVHDINKMMDKLIDFLVEKKYTPALFFKFSRKKCESICKTVRKSLLTFEEIADVENNFNYYMKNYKKTYEILPQYIDVYNQLKKGVVYHHSGLIPILKEIIEILYSKGLVKVLFATETFAIGVNMPTKTVLFTDLEKYDNNGLRELRSDEYLQMSGRAGRRGIDTFGSVIILPTNTLPFENSIKNMMTGKSPVLMSKFQLNYQFVLKMLISDNFDSNKFLSNTLIMNENDKKALNMIIEKDSIEKKMSSIIIDESILEKLNSYDKINKKLNDTFFRLKKKDIEKNEKEKKMIEELPNFKKEYEKFKLLDSYKKEYDLLNYNIYECNNLLNNNIEIIINILENEGYIMDKKITKKGIVAKGINECQELIFSEMIFRGLLDNLDFPEIIAILSSFINEKEGSEEKYISDINISENVSYVLKELNNICEYFIKIEDENQLYIGSDYNLYLDFVELAYIWASGGSIHDIYKHSNMYDGNFVKAIMRINNICENLMDICKNIERFDLCSKLENYNQILIRDITSINSLYI